MANRCPRCSGGLALHPVTHQVVCVNCRKPPEKVNGGWRAIVVPSAAERVPNLTAEQHVARLARMAEDHTLLRTS